MTRTRLMITIAVMLTGWLPVAAQSASLQERIRRDGKLPGGGAAYVSLVKAKYGNGGTRKAANRIAANSSSGNSVTQVGDQPAGFGKVFSWDRKDDEILLVAFINAADDLGISIDGIKRNDLVEIQSASGIASFSEDTGNPTASGIVGLLATGAKAAAGITGNSELIPVVSAAEEFAKDQFKATNAKTKRRDAYGVDPGSGHKAREEGGVLICLPGSGGTYYSGDGDTTSRWIKADGTRDDTHLPKHVPIGFAFFANRDPALRSAPADGQMYVLAWDWKFQDNAGYYKIFIHIKKGTENETPVPVV